MLPLVLSEQSLAILELFGPKPMLLPFPYPFDFVPEAGSSGFVVRDGLYLPFDMRIHSYGLRELGIWPVGELPRRGVEVPQESDVLRGGDFWGESREFVSILVYFP